MGKIIQYRILNYKATKEKEHMDINYVDFKNKICSKSLEIDDMPERSEEVLKFFHIDNYENGVPIVDILDKFGFKIYQSNLEPKGLSAYIAVDPKFEDVYGANKITCVQIEDSLGHKRFALAHELAHYLFDFDEKKQLSYYNTYFAGQDNEENVSDTIQERRANAFAANLLMPRNIFLRKLEEYKYLCSKIDIVSALGRYFKVSQTAVLKRFKELGIEGFDE